MSAIGTALSLCALNEKKFIEQFDFVIEYFDKIYKLMSRMGLEQERLAALPQPEQVQIRAYLYLLESAVTTSVAALRLLSANLCADLYGLIGVLYEIGSLMHYGNASGRRKEKLSNLLYNSELPDEEQQTAAAQLNEQALQLLEKNNPGLKKIRLELTAFSNHIVRKKIVMGKVTATGFDSVSTVIRSSVHSRYYFAGIDLLFNSLRMILDEYTIHNQAYKAVSIEVLTEVHSLGSGWVTRVRPKLQQMISDRVRP